jgi:hypothetical protein
MKKLLLCILSFGILIATPTKAEIVLYCQNELATGLLKKNDSWKTGSFSLSRYTIKFNDDFTSLDGLNYGEPLKCSPPFTNYSAIINCLSTDGFETFLYETQKKRFTYVSLTMGYVQGRDDTSSIEAGTCLSF